MASKLSLEKLFKILLESYGPQHWWPVYFSKARKNNQSGLSKAQLEIILGAILTQNTAWQNVELALANLDKAGLIDWRKIKAVPKNKLSRLIRPARYFNQKAEYIKTLIEAFDSGFSHSLSLSRLRNFLLGIKGIGPETADSILIYALGRPVFVVDAYTRRLFSRLGLIGQEARYQEIQDSVHTTIKVKGKRRVGVFNEFHALIVRHAAECCQVKPRCEKCPLLRVCSRKLKVQN